MTGKYRWGFGVAIVALIAIGSPAYADFMFVSNQNVANSTGYRASGIQYAENQDLIVTNANVRDYNNYNTIVRLSFGMKFKQNQVSFKRFIFEPDSANYQIYVKDDNGNVLFGGVFAGNAKVDDMGNGRRLFYANAVRQTLPNSQLNRVCELSFVWSVNSFPGYQIEYGYLHINNYTSAFTSTANASLPNEPMTFERFVKEYGLFNDDEFDELFKDN